MAIPNTSRELLLKTLGQGGETQVQRTAFDQSAASGSAGTSAPSFADTMDEAVGNLKKAYGSLSQEKQKLMTEKTKLELRKELMSNSAIKELIQMRGDLTRQVQKAPSKIEGRADVDPLAQGRLQGGDLAALVGAMSDVSGDIETRGTGINTVINAITNQQKQDLEGAKTEFNAAQGLLSSILGVEGEKRQQALLPGQLEGQTLENIGKRQKVTGTEPITPEQIIKVGETFANPEAVLEFLQNRQQTGTANLGQRHNNPLNLKVGSLSQPWLDNGKAEIGQAGLDGGKFVKFNSVEDGFAAAQNALFNSSFYGNKTLEQAMRTWSGKGYGADVSPGSPKNKPLSQFTVQEQQRLVMDMAKREGFFAGASKQDMKDIFAPRTEIGKALSNAEVLSYAKALGVNPTQEAVQQALAEGKSPQTTGQLEKTQAIQQSKSIVNQIKNISRNLNTEPTRFRQIAKYGAAAANQSDPNIAALNAYQASLTSLARSLGEKGVISDGDIARFGQAIPKWSSSKIQAESSIKTIEEILRIAEGTKPGTYENMYTKGSEEDILEQEGSQFLE